MTQGPYNPNNSNKPNRDAQRAEETLRLLAELPPPAELTDRVHRRLSYARANPPQRSLWSLWMPMQRLQFAGAALLVVAVAGSTWSVYHQGPHGQTSAGKGSGIPVIPANPQSGAFGSAAAKAHPATLTPIRVPATPKKKPSASHAAKVAPRPPAADTSPANASSPSNP